MIGLGNPLEWLESARGFKPGLVSKKWSHIKDHAVDHDPEILAL
jgi:hypothetical protein